MESSVPANMKKQKPQAQTNLNGAGQQINFQIPFLDTPVSSIRSASTSPMVDRRWLAPLNTVQNQSTNSRNSLNVPVENVSRKLSLQLVGKQRSSIQYNDCLISSNQLLNPSMNNSNKNSSLNVNTINNNSSNSINSSNILTVTNSHRLAPRKSVIGKFDRVSFQTQRLSDVGVAFGQQITAKIGLKLPASQERIVEQTRWLYLRYVFAKLRQNSLPLRDLNLTKSSRARRAAALGESQVSSSAPATSAPDFQSHTSILHREFVRRRQTSSGIDMSDMQLLTSRLSQMSYNEASTAYGSSSMFPLNKDQATDQIVPQATGKKIIMDTTINNQILIVIVRLIRELREMKSEYYSDTIYELIGIDKFSSLQSLLDVQMTICREMTRSEITWCRIVALFSLFGAMSLDCVRMGTPEHVGPIMDSFIEFVGRDLAFWISQQGGWESFLYKYRAGFRFRHLSSKLVTFSLPLFIWFMFIMFRWET